jgi:hypothetical protein
MKPRSGPPADCAPHESNRRRAGETKRPSCERGDAHVKRTLANWIAALFEPTDFKRGKQAA